MLAEPGAHDEAIDSLRSGLELRVVDELPLKLVLADADLALVPAGRPTTDGEPGAVLLQRSGLLAALDALFEAIWQRAYPLELSSFEDDAVPDDGDGTSGCPCWTGRSSACCWPASATRRSPPSWTSRCGPCSVGCASSRTPRA